MTYVREIKVTPVRVPLERPVAAAGKVFQYRDYLLVELTCEDGSAGIGFSYVGTGGGRAAASATKELLLPEVIGADPAGVEAIWERVYRATLIQGRAGLVMNGLSAIDIALWDRNASVAGLPLYRFLGGGGAQVTVPAYASGGYYADGKGPKELAEEIAAYAAQGFKAVKIKAGRLTVKEEERRVQAVRDVIGPDGCLLLDLYNAWTTLSEAMPYITMYRQYNPYWIEDPFMPDDLDNLARLAERITEPLATGEFHYTRFSFKHIIRAGVTILQPEAPRCGGITEWRRIAALASAQGIAISPCWFHQLHVHLLPSIPNGLFVEYFPDNTILNFGQLIDTSCTIVDGAIQLPRRPGVGFRFVPEAVAAFRLT
ncbi:MAG: mandelate racemase/muconate lactonizing enzyme family protein [Ardenticatenaceae bacterium]|nr:mandelate racemase/muconate lactonizing enzyme family protein [Ardenticatenaceae bacterium]HBY99124.1 racemase [Chloroflexota bacterium]